MTARAANIRAETARHRLTQTALARALGMSQVAVSDRHRGRTPWTLNEIEAVAQLLGTTTSSLCAIRDSNPEPAGLESMRRLWGRLLGRRTVDRRRPPAAEVVSLSAYRAAAAVSA